MTEELAPTLERIRTYWNRLDKMVSSNPNQVTKDSPLILTMAQGVRLGLDKKNRYHLLLDLSDGEEENTRRLTAGITIQTKHFQIEGVNSLWVDIVAEKRWRFAIEPFAADLVIEMKNGAIDLRTLNKLVSEYQALWRRPKEPLSPKAQRGLIGEMTVVERLDPIIGFAAAVDRWEGPYSELHDIMDDDWHLEVKSYSDEPPRVRISEVQQLDPRIGPKLTLVGTHIIGTSKGQTLPEFVDDFLVIAEEKGIESLALEKLNAAGWDEEDRNEYHSRFITGRIILCPIHLGTSIFPPHLMEELPHSVDKVTYRLALNELFFLNGKDDKNWELACSPGDWLDTDLDFGVSNELENNSPEFRLLVDTENIYRELAHRIYLQKFGVRWWKNVPSGPKQQAKAKIKEWRDKGNTGLEHPSRRYWDAMTTGSLIDSIKNKLIWPAFEEALEVKQETLTHHWRDFSNLRNTKFHSNEPHTEGELELGVGATKMIRSFAARALKKLSTDSEE